MLLNEDEESDQNLIRAMHMTEAPKKIEVLPSNPETT